MNEIVALLDGREVGTVHQLRGRLGFSYADSWRSAPGAYLLSLSMPLAAAEHPHRAIEALRRPPSVPGRCPLRSG